MLIPVAQNLRMSTKHQQYSLLNQSAAMASYAEQNGFASEERILTPDEAD